ncbi:rhotekin-like isoform X2 [Betta splendens]|uniref:Rhotekin-like isoform X2 n=1 Tax=Betta splendens TaxID=158456 RepID=A0A6P7NYX2_BETSP|nr:rhotekin-like isoform X2 [Betta splendens]
MDDDTANQDKEMLQQIEREVRMQEGASKLLAACSQREQALEASKSLLTCNARILALLGELQRARKARVLRRGRRRSGEDLVPCCGKVALSDLRVPLMWKDSEYFKNKGELQRCAVFCLLRCGTQIRDTDLVMVDRTLTDICFEDTFVFHDAAPDFQLGVELYSGRVPEDVPVAALGPRRIGRLGGSLGCSSGKRIRGAFESATGCGSASSEGASRPGSLSPPLSRDSSLVPKYNLLAHATLGLEHVQDGFKTHDLSLSASEDSAFWLPLYGNMCCRVAAQPLCMTEPVMSGRLQVKREEDLTEWESFYGVLRGQNLLCYSSRDDLRPDESEERPLLVIPITKDAAISVSEGDALRSQQAVRVATQRDGGDASYLLSAHTREDARRWTEALRQHTCNTSHWKQCCDHLMKIEAPSSRRSITVKQGSLYHEIVTPRAPSEGPAVPDLSVEIRALLSSYNKESY